MKIARHASLRVPNRLYIGTESIAIIASILLLGGLLLPVYAQSTEQAKLTADDAAAEDNFGDSVSISGDTAVVGSPFDDDAGSSSGSAYVYVLLQPSPAAEVDQVDARVPAVDIPIILVTALALVVILALVMIVVVRTLRRRSTAP